jgi:hypothetical protein
MLLTDVLVRAIITILIPIARVVATRCPLASGWIITTTIEGNLAADLLQVQRPVIIDAIHSCDDGRGKAPVAQCVGKGFASSLGCSTIASSGQQ